MGGEISFESKYGVGSEFSVYFPLNLTKSMKSENKYTTPLKNNWLGKVILIVDDAASVVLYLESILADTNATVVSVSNGKEAIDFLKNNGVVDVILMDIEMDVMNGYDATKIIKASYNIPIIIQSAHAMKEHEEKAKEVGADDIVFKPIDTNLLFNKINKLFIRK